MNTPKTVPDRPVHENKNLATKNSDPATCGVTRQLECLCAARPLIAAGAAAFMYDEILTRASDEPSAWDSQLGQPGCRRFGKPRWVFRSIAA